MVESFLVLYTSQGSNYEQGSLSHNNNDCGVLKRLISRERKARVNYPNSTLYISLLEDLLDFLFICLYIQSLLYIKRINAR